MGDEAAGEGVDIHGLGLAPSQLGGGYHTWERLIPHAVHRGHPLGPEVGLHTQHQLLLLGVESLDGVKAVDGGDGVAVFLIVDVELGVGRAYQRIAMRGARP